MNGILTPDGVNLRNFAAVLRREVVQVIVL